jgi:hypothetical protein
MTGGERIDERAEADALHDSGHEDASPNQAIVYPPPEDFHA